MHPTDVILLPPYAGGLLVWPVFAIASKNRDALFLQLRKIFDWTVAGVAVLAGGQWLIGLVTSPPVLFTSLIATVNLVSLLAAMAAFFQASKGRVRVFLERNFIAVAGIPAFSLAVMFLIGGCRNIDIALHEDRATATVLPAMEGGGRKSIHYSYEVDGQTYTGIGDSGNPPYPPGSTFEIRYCTLHPSFSTPRSPFEFAGIICVGSVFAGAASFMAKRSKR